MFSPFGYVGADAPGGLYSLLFIIQCLLIKIVEMLSERKPYIVTHSKRKNNVFKLIFGIYIR